MLVGILEEIIDDNYVIVFIFVGLEYYVSILLFVDKDMLEFGCIVLLNYKVIIRYFYLYFFICFCYIFKN